MFVGSSVTRALSYSAEINSSCWSSTTNGRRTGSTYWKWIHNWYQCKYWHRWWQHNNKQMLADKHVDWSTLLMANIETRLHFHVCAFYGRTRLHRRGKLGMRGQAARLRATADASLVEETCGSSRCPSQNGLQSNTTASVFPYFCQNFV